MKRIYYFLLLICLMMINFTSCKDMLGMAGDVTPIHDSIAVHDTIHDSTAVVVPPSWVTVDVWSDKDTIIISNDTIYHCKDSTAGGAVVDDPTEMYKLESDVQNNGTSYFDPQWSSYLLDDEEVLGVNVDRSAEVSNKVDSMFLENVGTVNFTVSRPSKKEPGYDVKGGYDITTEYKDFTVYGNDGSEYDFATESQSASAMFDGKKKNLLYRMVQTVEPISVNDVLTNDTVIKGKDIYCKSNRTFKARVRSLHRPLMGPEIVTVDTLTISSALASKNNGIAEVYIKVGEVEDTVPVIPEDTVPVTPPDTVPVTPPDTVPVTPPDTVPVTPPDPVVPDSGYTVDDEVIESITYSYTVSPDKTLKGVLFVRFKTYVMPVVDRQILAPVPVTNPNDYNSVAWSNGGWVPADLRLDQGFVWYVGGSVVVSATDATIDWLARATGISSLSRGDFLKDATFVNEGKTTRVYIDNVFYMTLSK